MGGEENTESLAGRGRIRFRGSRALSGCLPLRTNIIISGRPHVSGKELTYFCCAGVVSRKRALCAFTRWTRGCTAARGFSSILSPDDSTSLVDDEVCGSFSFEEELAFDSTESAESSGIDFEPFFEKVRLAKDCSMVGVVGKTRSLTKSDYSESRCRGQTRPTTLPEESRS